MWAAEVGGTAREWGGAVLGLQEGRDTQAFGQRRGRALVTQCIQGKVALPLKRRSSGWQASGQTTDPRRAFNDCDTR